MTMGVDSTTTEPAEEPSRIGDETLREMFSWPAWIAVGILSIVTIATRGGPSIAFDGPSIALDLVSNLWMVIGWSLILFVFPFAVVVWVIALYRWYKTPELVTVTN